MRKAAAGRGFYVRHEGDKVVFDLGGRVRDVMVTCGEAERLAHALRDNAARAEAAPPELVRGEVWGTRVESYDGYVAIRFTPPFAGHPTVVKMPGPDARKLADLVDFKRQQAAYKMRFVLDTEWGPKA